MEILRVPPSIRLIQFPINSSEAPRRNEQCEAFELD